jgi:two-component system cell cycle sensor histidine kinase/response regulator CckA
MLDRLKRGEFVDHFETLRVRRGGNQFDIEITSSPIRDPMETIVGISSIGRDISARKAAEEQLVQMEARYRGLLEAAPDAMVIVNPAGEIVLLNLQAEKQFGYRRDELLGQNVTRIVPEGFAERLLAQQIDAGDTAVSQMGTGIELHGRCKDVERKRIEGMLLQAQKMEVVGQLAGGIAHDFNNLLGVILGYTDLLLDRPGLSDPQRKDIGEIRKAGDRAALLTRQLLAFSRKQVLQPKTLDLNGLIAGTQELLRRLIGEHIELQFVCEPEMCRVKADPGQIEQIVMNLVLNARDAMPAGGNLTIGISTVKLDEDFASRHQPTQPGSYAMLTVTDTGCGMDSETMDRMFDPFFTTKSFGKGTGLGLTIVYGIVKQNGGSVVVHSELGLGTTFNIYLPCVAQLPESEPLLGEVEKIEHGSRTIMVVEDDAALLQVTRRSLVELGYTVLSARNSAEAMDVSLQHPGHIHLMVTDVIMPGISGAQLASRLSDERPQMKVLYVSGYTDDAIVHHGVLEPGLAFLQKPFSPKTLARTVSELLATHSPLPNPAASGITPGPP